MCEKLRATRQCSSIKDIFAPIHSQALRARAIELTRTFDDFTPDNEHDFGSFEIDDQKFIFKHDYYDKSLQYSSEDPGDPKKTTRVLTIMLADEY